MQKRMPNNVGLDRNQRFAKPPPPPLSFRLPSFPPLRSCQVTHIVLIAIMIIYFWCDMMGLALMIWKITYLENGLTWCNSIQLMYVTENRKDLPAEEWLVLFLTNNELRFRIWLRSIDFCFCIQCSAALACLECPRVCEGSRIRSQKMFGLRWGPDEHRFLIAGALVMAGSVKQAGERRKSLFVVDWFSLPLRPALYCGWIAGCPRAEAVGSAERAARKPAGAPEPTRLLQDARKQDQELQAQVKAWRPGPGCSGPLSLLLLTLYL